MNRVRTDKLSPRPTRRAGSILGLLVAAFSPLTAWSALEDLRLLRVTERVSVITGAGGNVVVFETPEGLALVDSGSAEQSAYLLEFIDEAFDGAPVRVLFNTHWHLDHTGANEAVAARGARIIAHENTRLWMGTEYYVEWEQKNYGPRAETALPTETFYSSDPQPLFYELGGHRIEYGHLVEAHTDGDIYVRFIDDDVVAVGDVLAVDEFPLLDYSTGGWIGGARDSTQKLLEMVTPATQIIAGDGPPQDRAALAAQAALLDELRERIRVRMLAGKGVDEIHAENIMTGYEALPDPRQFINNVYQGLWWGGRIRGAY
ncbi:MAG TPA: MBL fold metallo-hydrolase [Gammaproteobacteria bacterium]|jgi:glyoxylase-like metal-dependent hydrolase (beta-lactamase superfamily II)